MYIYIYVCIYVLCVCVSMYNLPCEYMHVELHSVSQHFARIFPAKYDHPHVPVWHYNIYIYIYTHIYIRKILRISRT